MTVFAQDAYSGTTGIDINGRTLDGSGGTWARHATFATGSLIITATGQRVRPANANTALAIYYASGTPGSADYDVQADLLMESNVTGSDAGVVGRVNTGADTMYGFVFVQGAGWTLFKRVAGVYTTLDSVSTTLSLSTTYTIKLVMRGTTLAGFVNNVQVCGAVDSAISAAGLAGLFVLAGSGLADGTGYQLTNFLAQTVAVARPYNGIWIGAAHPTFPTEASLSASNNAGSFGNCISLVAASSEYVWLPDPGPFDFAANATWTIEARVRHTAAVSATEVVAGICGSGSQFGWYLGINTSGNLQAFVNGLNGSAAFAGGAINDGNWHTVQLVVTGGTSAQLYLDNAASGSAATGVAYIPPTTGLVARIGAYGATIGAYWNGQVDAVSAWSIARAGENPTTPFTGSEASQLALYNFEADAKDTFSGFTLALTPGTVIANAGVLRVSAVGGATTWNTGAPTFAVTGGTGASTSASNIVVIDATHCQFTINVGTAPGTLSITDSTTGVATAITVVNGIVINDSNLLYSPYNVEPPASPESDAAWRQMDNPGAYLKGQLTGATALTLLFDVSPQLGFGDAGVIGTALGSADYPQLVYSINDAPVTSAQIPTNGALALASGLTAGNSATIYAEFQSISTGSNYRRWTNANQVLKLIGIQVGAADTATTQVAAGAVAKRTGGYFIVFGDSISEAANTNGTASGTSFLTSQDATVAYVKHIAAAFNLEYGIVAYSGQGYNVATSGDNPAFNTSWQYYRNGKSRLSAGRLSPMPTYGLVNQGTNDGSGLTSGLVTTAVTNVTGATSGTTWFFLVPFGDNPSTNYGGAAIRTALASPPAGVSLLDLYNAVTPTGPWQVGLNHVALVSGGSTSAASRQSPDNLHPRPQTHAYLAALLVQQIQKNISPTSGVPQIGSPLIRSA